MLLIASLHPATTIARIDGRWPSLLPSCSKTGGENERLGAGAYRGSRCRLRHSIYAVGPKIPSTKAVKAGPFHQPTIRRQIASLALQRHYPVLASIASRSFFLIGELLLGKLSETVVVQGNAPHNRPGFLVVHLIGNRASFLCTKAPMLGDPQKRTLCIASDRIGRDVQAIFRRRHQHRFCGTTPSIADFWTNRGRRAAPLAATSGVPPILPPAVLTPARSLPSG